MEDGSEAGSNPTTMGLSRKYTRDPHRRLPVSMQQTRLPHLLQSRSTKLPYMHFASFTRRRSDVSYYSEAIFIHRRVVLDIGQRATRKHDDSLENKRKETEQNETRGKTQNARRRLGETSRVANSCMNDQRNAAWGCQIRDLEGSRNIQRRYASEFLLLQTALLMWKRARLWTMGVTF